MGILRPLPALPALLLLSLLPSSGAQENPKLQVWVDPPNPVILAGTSVTVNCSTDCADSPTIGLETRLVKNVESSGTNWKAFRLSNVTQDSSPLCFVNNCPGKSQGITRANIVVFEPPKNLELNLEPSQEHPSDSLIPVGWNLTLSCRVAGGRPRQNLSMVLLRGTQVISRQPVPENTLDTATVEFPITARRQGNETSFFCRAELDLQPRGLELYESSSAPLKFYTYEITSKPPNLMASPVLEAGTEKQVSCDMDKLFPVEKAHIQLFWRGQSLAPNSTTQQGDLLRVTATITAEEEGDQELTCRVTLGNETRQISENVTVYYLSEPHFTASEPIKKGSLVNLSCQADFPARAVIEGAPPNETDRLSLRVQEKDNGRVFTCYAVLELRGEKLTKKKTLKLNFSVPLKLDEECTGNWIWPEETEQTLECTARGNPAPTVKCVLENKQGEILVGVPQWVTRTLNGTYLCTANNSLGEANKSVSGVVQIQEETDLTPVLVGILVSVVALSLLSIMGYIYYRQRRIRSYELKKAQEARAMQLIKPEAKLCP